MPQKIVLVVGASSGLGRAAAQCLAADGHIVYAAARSFANGAEPPTGCFFHPRCKYCQEKCRTQSPESVQMEGGTHRYKCFYPLGNEQDEEV